MSTSKFGHRQVYAVAGCYFVASFAALGLPPYFTEILPELGDPTGHWTGLLYIVPTVFGGLGAPLWGRLADRCGRKPLLLRAQLGLAVAFVLAGLADSLPLFTAALVLQGVLGGTFVASTGYLAAALQGSALARALTALQASARAALVFAPITVGALSQWLTPHRQYIVLALLPLSAALLLAWLPEPRSARRTATRATADHPAATASAPVHVLFALEFVFVFTTVVSFPYFIALVSDRLPSTSAIVAGVLFALPHLVYLLSSPAVHRMFSTPRRPIVLGFFMLAVGLTAHAMVDSPAGFVTARLLLGAGLTLSLVGRNMMAANCAAGRPPGGMFGSLEFFTKAGAVAAGLAATALNSGFGPNAPPLSGALAAVVFLIAVVVHRFSRSRESSHAHPR
ncbi:MFS transporter [Nocardia brevicatena]|uniref:MFS transporter n=1 Tax=Nocardia brevicatena TaxID=37327 RepID=UPI0002EEA142|nr:MFS transporter [Nocardia brevicatena]